MSLPFFLPPTLKFLSIFPGFPRSAILIPYLPHVKTFNKIKIFSYQHPYFKISCNLKHTYFILFYFFFWGGGEGGAKHYRAPDQRKPAFGVSDQAKHESTCSATETSYTLDFLHMARFREIVQTEERITKALAPLLFTCIKVRVLRTQAQFD